MTDAIIFGKWQGYYTYGSGYSPEIQQKKFDFTMELWNDEGIIKGISFDGITEEFFEEPAKIEGNFEDHSITFLMTYPCRVELDENNKIRTVPGKPSSGILYTGMLRKSFFSNQYIFRGEWDISNSWLDENKRAVYSTGMGTWMMRKIPG